MAGEPNKPPWGIAIGTDGQNGIYVYELTGMGRFPLVRYYRDHVGRVTSLSQSADGKYLASSSIDKTIKVWSLDRADLGDTPFPMARQWGAVFEIRNGQVIVTHCAEAGIAANRGLAVGDAVTSMIFTNELGAVEETNDPARILRALSTTPVWQQVGLTLQGRQGPPRAFNVVPGWEPLMTLFVADAQWALYTPQGPYHASDQGDALFGWQINRGEERTPDFFVAEQFRQKLEQREVLQRLLDQGSLSAALAFQPDAPAINLQRIVSEQADQTPRVTIDSPRHGETFTKDGLPIVAARVMFPPGRSPGDFKVTLYINGIEQLDPIVNLPLPNGEQLYHWSTSLVESTNAAAVLAEPTQQLNEGGFGFQSVRFRAEATAAPNRLHVLALAADAYRGRIALNYSRNDAESLIEQLTKGAPGLYTIGRIEKLFNEQINDRNVTAAIDRIQTAVGAGPAGDLLVVVLNGHGISVDKEYYFVPPDDKLESLEDNDQNRALIKQMGISWTHLMSLARIRCRKVVLLDTCHSGNAALASNPLWNNKASIRPFTREHVLVVSATSCNGLAFEDDSLKHGIFTFCLLQGLQGKADGSDDGDVDFQETVKYLRDTVPQITSDARQRQVPVSAPADLQYLFDIVPLSRYR